MMKGLANPVTGVLLLLWLNCVLVSCQGPTYNYDPTSPNGPAQWGSLNPAWVQCSTGTQQSPIDIASPITHQPHHPLGLVYTRNFVHAEIFNNGHTPTVEIVTPNAGTLTIYDETYQLQDFHFHLPSEHLISHHRRAMEMHLVHNSSVTGKIAVVALLYECGFESPFLSQFFNNLPPFTPPNVKTSITIRLPDIGHHHYYRYNGSFTTPPCTGNVNWTIIDHNFTLSNHQLHQLQAALPEDNARPIQPRNGRPIFYYS